MSSEESLFVLAQLHWWCLMLFKSGLRKSQSCCWQSLFSAPGVSIAPGHEAHRIYAGDKEGGFHNAWWSACDTLPQSDPYFSGCRKICKETLKIMANKCLYSDQVLHIIVLKSEMKDGGKKYLKVRERLMVYEWRVSRFWGGEIRFSAWDWITLPNLGRDKMCFLEIIWVNSYFVCYCSFKVFNQCFFLAS